MIECSPSLAGAVTLMEGSPSLARVLRSLSALKKKKRIFLSSDVNIFTISIYLHRCNYYIKAEDESKEMKIVEGAFQGTEHGTVLKGALEQVPSPQHGSCSLLHKRLEFAGKPKTYKQQSCI